MFAAWPTALGGAVRVLKILMILYLKLTHHFQAAKIFRSLGDNIKVPNVMPNLDILRCTLAATGSPSPSQAAQAYAMAGEYATAARLYEEASHVREAVENFLRAAPWKQL